MINLKNSVKHNI